MLAAESVALSLIALITALMAAFESALAFPGGSTVLFADALTFLQHSISAGIALRYAAGSAARQRWTVQMEGFVMMVLAALVIAVAFRWLVQGSIPHPPLMMTVGVIALVASLGCSAIMYSHRETLGGARAVWKLAQADSVSHIALIAAGAAAMLTRSNIPDLVIGTAMCVFMLASGGRMVMTGRVDGGR